jgi:hypothetical protein
MFLKRENGVYIPNGVYSAIKKNEIVSLARKWMEPEIIMLSEIIHFHKDKYHMFSLIHRS